MVDISKNPLFRTYQTVLIAGLTRDLYERHNLLVHFQPGARDILHFMPPMIIAPGHIDRLVAALDDIFARGIAKMSRSEEHTSELQSLMRNSYAVFCLKKKNNKRTKNRIVQQLTNCSNLCKSSIRLKSNNT